MRNMLNGDEADILSRLADGEHTFRPGRVSTPGAFATLVEQLRALDGRGLIGLRASRISRTERGSYLMVGPCELTPAGREALEHDRGLGPRAA